VLNVRDLARTEQVLTGVMNMRRVRDYAAHGAHIHVFAMGEGGPRGAARDRAERFAGTRPGAGGVHTSRSARPTLSNITPGAAAERYGIRNSGEIDRFYFRSLYFREPTASCSDRTDGPGFATDEPMETLGENWRCRRFWSRAAPKS